MNVNVKNGTPLHGTPLCETCAFAHVKRGFRESEVLVICVAADPAHRVPFPIRECSVYRDKTRPSFHEMEKIALIVTPRNPKRPGFVPVNGSPSEEAEIELKLDESE
jgi:hypothetical protein